MPAWDDLKTASADRDGAGPEVSGAPHLSLRLSPDPHRMDTKRHLEIPVFDLGCGGAGASMIERELAATDGVLRAYVNPASETAYVDYDPAEVDPAHLVLAIERAGYRPGVPLDV